MGPLGGPQQYDNAAYLSSFDELTRRIRGETVEPGSPTSSNLDAGQFRGKSCELGGRWWSQSSSHFRANSNVFSEEGCRFMGRDDTHFEAILPNTD
jgi:hypothetical protein